MEDRSIERRANEEKNKILDLLVSFNVSERRMNMLDSVIDNVAWMKVKLDDTREVIKTAAVVIQYDNGGGQKGLRENPIFKGYESLWKSYMSGMDKILSSVPDEAFDEVVKDEEKPKSVLEMVRARHDA